MRDIDDEVMFQIDLFLEGKKTFIEVCCDLAKMFPEEDEFIKTLEEHVDMCIPFIGTA